MSAEGFLAAAYVVLAGLYLGYFVRLRARRRRVGEELARLAERAGEGK